jgi:hypothetical protein
MLSSICVGPQNRLILGRRNTFQFRKFDKTTFRSLDDFLGRLVPFLKRLPQGHKFAVESRNKDWLVPKLADVLRE